MAYQCWSRMDVPTYRTPSVDPRFNDELDITVLQGFTLKAADMVRAYVAMGRDADEEPLKRTVSLKEVRRDLIPRLNDLLQKEMHEHRPFAGENVPERLRTKATRATHYGPFLRKTIDVVFKDAGYSFHESHNDSGYSWKG